jgi:hypothetical protein
MPSALRLLAVLVAVALAGCSDSKGGGDNPDATPTGATSQGGNSTAGPAQQAVASLELANETLDFAATGGGAADSLTVEVPATHGNVTVRFQVYADCPTGYATSPRLAMVDADGTETELWAYAMAAPADAAEPYTCPASDPVEGRERQSGDVDFAAVTGALTVRTEGEFTGEVDVVVIVSA